jgi:hypothetical protein
MEVEHADLGAWHRREILYSPGQQLIVTDSLRDDDEHRYVQWHHFDSALELSGDDGLFQVSDGNITIDVRISSSCGDLATYKKIKGQTEPRIQGWASIADRERQPRWALGVECAARNATFEARFSLPAM